MNFDKCNLFYLRSEYWDIWYPEEKFDQIQRKKEAIKNLPPPKDVTGVKSLMGVINYFRKFIPNCSIMAEPILILIVSKMRLRSDFNWGDISKLVLKHVRRLN